MLDFASMRMLRDRRGAGIAEYALLLFLIVVIAAVTYRVMGQRVGRAGNKTNQEFQAQHAGNKSGGAGQGAPGDSAGGGAQPQGGAGGGAAGAGGGGGGGAASAQAAGAKPSDNSSGSAPSDEEEPVEQRKIPFWKIIGAVILVLFAVGGYLAFRKGNKAG
jgi:hypothetical protein